MFLDQTSLCALALTSKATKLSASEALYRTYTNRDAPSKAPFHLILRTLFESPELSAVVKELNIRGWRSEFEVATGLKWAGVTEIREDKLQPSRTGPVFVSTSTSTNPRTKSLKLFEEVAVKIGILSSYDAAAVPRLKKTVVTGSMLKKDEDFLRLLRHGVEDAQVVLMLALLPNLTRLHVDGMSIYSTLDWHYFLRSSDTALQALRELDVLSHSSACRHMMHSTTMGFLEFAPNPERLHLSGVHVEKSRRVTDLMSNKKLGDFEAVECQLDLQVLRNMLAGQKLTDFYYRPALEGSTQYQKRPFRAGRHSSLSEGFTAIVTEALTVLDSVKQLTHYLILR